MVPRRGLSSRVPKPEAGRIESCGYDRRFKFLQSLGQPRRLPAEYGRKDLPSCGPNGEQLKRLSLFFIASLLLAFLVLGVLVRYSVLQRFDFHASTEVQETSNPGLDAAMLAVTFVGSPAFICVVAVVVAAVFWLRGRRTAAVFVALTTMSLPFVFGLKEIWSRARPDEKVFHVYGSRFGFSFPSGHALMSTTFYGALAVLCWIHLSGARRNAAVTTFALAPIAVGVSRVYLGAHWVSDVLGGYVGGLILLFVLTAFYGSTVAGERWAARDTTGA